MTLKMNSFFNYFKKHTKMKKLEKFLTANPSYTKWGSERIAEKTGIALSTVVKFKKSEVFKQIKNSYINN